MRQNVAVTNFRAESLTFAGAVAGPPLIALCVGASDGAPRLWLQVCGELALLSLVTGVIWRALRTENIASAVLGLRPPDARTLLSASLLVLFLHFVYAPAASWLLPRLDPQFAARRAAFMGLAPGWRIVVILIGGCAEELLYRGYALTRLIEWTRRPWLAVFAAALIFGAAHGPAWGAGLAFITTVAGLIFGGCFLWWRDLPALMLAHVLTDLAALG
jgi:membrane protease YdiL (CAAX protease family)